MHSCTRSSYSALLLSKNSTTMSRWASSSAVGGTGTPSSALTRRQRRDADLRHVLAVAQRRPRLDGLAQNVGVGSARQFADNRQRVIGRQGWFRFDRQPRTGRVLDNLPGRSVRDVTGIWVPATPEPTAHGTFSRHRPANSAQLKSNTCTPCWHQAPKQVATTHDSPCRSTIRSSCTPTGSTGHKPKGKEENRKCLH
jgi:hypothetical protein